MVVLVLLTARGDESRGATFHCLMMVACCCCCECWWPTTSLPDTVISFSQSATILPSLPSLAAVAEAVLLNLMPLQTAQTYNFYWQLCAMPWHSFHEYVCVSVQYACAKVWGLRKGEMMNEV